MELLTLGAFIPFPRPHFPNRPTTLIGRKKGFVLILYNKEKGANKAVTLKQCQLDLVKLYPMPRTKQRRKTFEEGTYLFTGVEVERRGKTRKIFGKWEEVKRKRRKIFGEGKSDDGQRNRISSCRLAPFCGKGRVKAFDATVKVYVFGHKHTRTTGETAASFERVPRGWSCQYIFNWICLTPPLQFNFSDNISD